MLELAAVALTLGAVLNKSFAFGVATIALIAVSGILFCFVATRTKQGLLFALSLGGTFVFGALLMVSTQHTVADAIYGKRVFDARVISVDRRLTQTRLVVEDSAVRYQVTVLTTISALPNDTVRIRGLVARPEPFVTQSGRIFDYPLYLESRGIVAVVQPALVELRESGSWSVSRFATTLRFAIADTFTKNISFPIDGVIAGMLVGYQGGLPQSVQDLFRTTGVLHVLVLSGYNVTLLAGFLMVVLRMLPFRTRTAVTVLCIALLVLISGSGIASIRAGIMGSIALFAGLVRRTYQPLRALTLAYLLFFFISPTTIFADPGFHLSFLATLFMILVLPKVERLFFFLPRMRVVAIREIVVLAISVPIFMLPYTMYFAGTIPLASPFSNMTLSLVTPVFMIGGAIVLLVSVFLPVAGIVGSVLGVGGSVVLSFLRILDTLPHWNAPEIPWWMVTLTYGVLFSIIFRKEFTTYALQLQNSLLRRSN